MDGVAAKVADESNDVTLDPFNARNLENAKSVLGKVVECGR